MKPLLVKIRPAHADDAAPKSTDDALGGGMDIALTMLLFIGAGLLLDRWLGTRPLLTISLTVVAAVGLFLRMKSVYDRSMDRLEAERRVRVPTEPSGPSTTEGAA